MKYKIITSETTYREHFVEADSEEAAATKLFDYEHGEGEIISGDNNVEIEEIELIK